MFGLRSKLRIGLDLGSHSIKIAVIEKVGPRFRLVNWKCSEMYTGGDRYDPEGPKKSVAVPQLMKIMIDMNITPKRVKRIASCIGGHLVSVKEISSIMQTEAEMATSLLLEARKHIPLDGSETIVDYQLMGDDVTDTDKVRVLLVATTRKNYETHQDLLREIEIKPGIIDIEPLASLNSYLINSQLPDEGVVVFLHIGAKKTILSVYGRRDQFFSRDLPIGGQIFTDELINQYNLDYQEAEKVKKEQGMTPDIEKKSKDDASSLSLAEKSTFEKFGDEINRSLRFYVKETGQSVFTHFVLTGGGALLPGLDTYMNNKFNLPMELYNPFNQLDSRIPIDSDNPYQMATAIGLAIRGDL
ncbi:MAG: type IV pilus assembly protein PilM [Candidatus Hatepunaea meridiana]|nr:type IV pilus assembly protein PilM [Candidatus Hatepunaea meridiana]